MQETILQHEASEENPPRKCRTYSKEFKAQFVAQCEKKQSLDSAGGTGASDQR